MNKDIPIFNNKYRHCVIFESDFLLAVVLPPVILIDTSFLLRLVYILRYLLVAQINWDSEVYSRRNKSVFD